MSALILEPELLEQAEKQPAPPPVRWRDRPRKFNHWAAVAPDEFVRLPRFHPLPYLKEAKLFEAAQRGDVRARNVLWLRNARLALSTVNLHRFPRDLLGDVIQESLLKLPRAIERFEVHRYNAFSTYAWYWLRNGAQRFLFDARFSTPVPAHLYADYLRFRNRAQHESFDEDARHYCHQLREWKPDLFLRFLRLKAIHDAESLRRRHRQIADPRTVPTRRQSKSTPLTDHLEPFLARIRPRSADILRRRFGMGEHTRQSLREIGQAFGLSRERIRQLESAAMKKLRRYILHAIAADSHHPLAEFCETLGIKPEPMRALAAQ